MRMSHNGCSDSPQSGTTGSIVVVLSHINIRVNLKCVLIVKMEIPHIKNNQQEYTSLPHNYLEAVLG